MKTKRVLIALTTVFLGASLTQAQTQARITGKVVDSSGNPVVGATIAVEDLATSRTYEQTSNKKGRFTVGVVNGGNPHQVVISMPDYAPLSNEVTPGAGGIFQQTFILQPATATGQASGGGGAERMEGGGAAVRLFNRGVDAYNEGDLLAAREKMQEALAEDPELAEAHKILASVALDRAEFETALEHAGKFLSYDPADTVGLTLSFDALAGLGRYAEAVELLPKMAAAQPTEQTAARAFNAASALYQDDDLETAEAALNAALSADPNQAKSLLLLADIKLQNESFDDAVALAGKLLALEPGNVRALAVQHRSYVKTGDSENARAVFGLLAEADPKSVAVTFTEEGVRLFESGQIQDAVEVLQEALRLDADNARANYQLGLAYVGEGKSAEAKQLLSRFLALAPNHPEAGSAQAMLEYLN